MTNTASISSCAHRWNALLAENGVLHQEHRDLVSSFTPPYSAQQIAELEASAARQVELPKKIQKLVEEWANTVSP